MNEDSVGELPAADSNSTTNLNGSHIIFCVSTRRHRYRSFTQVFFARFAAAGCGSNSTGAYEECRISMSLSETRCPSQFATGDVPSEASTCQFALPFGPRTGAARQPCDGGCTEGMLPSLGQIMNPLCAFESRFELTLPDGHPIAASFANGDSLM